MRIIAREALLRYLTLTCALFAVACFPQKNSKSKQDKSPDLGYAVHGSVRALEHTAVDSDVNDPHVPYTPNDTVPQAQVLTNPVSLGGYLNLSKHGPAGDSYLSGDSIDVFDVNVQAGQSITLTIGDAAASTDLDLLLLNDNMEIIDGSFGVGATETLTVTAAHLEQKIYIAVVICGSSLYRCEPLPAKYVGASTYVMSIGDAAPNDATATGLHLNDAFVTGEVVAQFNTRVETTAMPSGLGAVPDGGQVHLLRLTNMANMTSTITASGLHAATRASALNSSTGTGIPLQAKLDTLMAVKALRRRTDVVSADLNYLRTALLTPNDSAYRYQWHYQIINLPQAWDVTTGAAQNGAPEVIVAVIDTGVLLNHPDLQDKVIAGYDFIADVENARDGNGMDNDANDPGDQTPGGRSSFHGTHVAGTIAAASNNSLGGVGVSWNAKIMPLRVLGKTGGTSYDVMQAVLYAAGLNNNSGDRPPRRADVINLSLGGGGYSKAEQDAFGRARAAGVIIVAAAGNNDSTTASYPAAYNGVISVSAVDSKLGRAYYSNYGASIDIAAPGGSMQWDVNRDGQLDGILSSSGDDSTGTLEYGYSILTGTSMAAPHVAGVVALMKALKPDLTPNAFDALLASGALTQDLGIPGRDENFGYGMIDALKAVTAAAEFNGQAPTPPSLVAFPSALNFETTHTRLTLVVSNGGGGSLSAQTATTDVAWINLEPQLDEAGLGSYAVSVDRRKLKPGTYTATLTIAADANTLLIPVYVTVEMNYTTAQALDYQWVVLVDAKLGTTVAATPAVAGTNGYEFNFTNISPGNYYVVVGSDLDNDQSICDSGEACGAYAPEHDIIPITVTDKDVDGIDLSCGFDASGALLFSSRFVVPLTGVTRAVTWQ